jgi:hypothetical protein
LEEIRFSICALPGFGFLYEKTALLSYSVGCWHSFIHGAEEGVDKFENIDSTFARFRAKFLAFPPIAMQNLNRLLCALFFFISHLYFSGLLPPTSWLFIAVLLPPLPSPIHTQRPDDVHGQFLKYDLREKMPKNAQ